MYAVVECVFSTILPRAVKPGYEFVPLHWGLTLILYGLYPAIGLVLGALCGLSARLRGTGAESSEPFLKAAASFTVVLAFAGNFVLNHTVGEGSLGLSGVITMVMSLVLAVALVSSARSGGLSFIANPWTVSITLLGLPWIDWELLPGGSKTAVAFSAVIYVAVVFLLSFVVSGFARRAGPMNRALRYAFVLVPLYAVTIVLNIALEQGAVVTEGPPAATATAAERPNLILITMDTVRADHTSLYGYERDTTPFLKELAKGAVLYKRHIATSDITLSTHASLFTGLYTSTHGAHFGECYPTGRPLHGGFRTLAEILSEKGYNTTAILANHGGLGPHFDLQQGFRYYEARQAVVLLGYTKPYFIRKGIRTILKRFASPVHFDRVCHRADEINRDVFAFLDGAKDSGKPFFLFVNYMDAHWPYMPPPPYDRLFPGKVESFTTTDYYNLTYRVMAERLPIGKDEFFHLVSQYDGGIAYIDFNLSRLVSRLKELGLYDNSMIIITSDHGEAFGEKLLVEHGVSVYQNQVYVPLVIKYPRSDAGRVVEEIVSSVDILPTVLDVFDIENDSDLQGVSLAGGGTGANREIISESFPPQPVYNLHDSMKRVERAVFSWPYKLIVSTKGKRELYDLSKDPVEAVNLHTFNNPVSARLNNSLARWLEAAPALSSYSGRLSTDAVERLKALGYVQ